MTSKNVSTLPSSETKHPPTDQALPLKERFRHFTWAWYTTTMATGGIATLLHSTPHTFTGLYTIGKIILIFDIVLFALFTAVITLRFIQTPRLLKDSLTHPSESLFFPCFWLSIASIMLGIQAYGVPVCGTWLVTTMRVLFWMYVACSFSVACIQYFILFSSAHCTVHGMMPSWILPAFPVMLTGTLAASIAGSQPVAGGQRMNILVAGVTCQGFGFLVSSIMYPIYLGRLMDDGLPGVPLRPGMFISVGPPSFTGLAIIGMANAIPTDYGYFARTPGAAETLQVVALFVALWLWTLGCWFFAISTSACVAAIGKTSFSLTWWSYVFPNTGFAIATISIGRSLNSEAILWVGSVMTILLVAMWLFVGACHVRALWLRQILWPGHDEDKYQ